MPHVVVLSLLGSTTYVRHVSSNRHSPAALLPLRIIVKALRNTAVKALLNSAIKAL